MYSVCDDVTRYGWCAEDMRRGFPLEGKLAEGWRSKCAIGLISHVMIRLYHAESLNHIRSKLSRYDKRKHGQCNNLLSSLTLLLLPSIWTWSQDLAKIKSSHNALVIQPQQERKRGGIIRV